GLAALRPRRSRPVAPGRGRSPPGGGGRQGRSAARPRGAAGGSAHGPGRAPPPFPVVRAPAGTGRGHGGAGRARPANVRSMPSSSAPVREAVILAGGQATRLRPYTDTRPKAMVEVADRPIIDYQLEWLAGHGVRHAVVSCGYKAEVLREHLA